MKVFRRRLNELEAQAFENAHSDMEYKRIRADVLRLLAEAKITLSAKNYEMYKPEVIKTLCEICGTHLDLEVLEKFAPHILSREDLETIIQNSGLGRWF